MKDLSRRAEEEAVESVHFLGFFIGFFVSIAFSALVFFPYLLPFVQRFGWAGSVGVVLGVFCILSVLISTPFALRDLHSRGSICPVSENSLHIWISRAFVKRFRFS